MAVNRDELADAVQFWLLLSAAVVFCVIAGRVVGQFAPPVVLAGMGAVVIGLITFMFPKAGLAIVVFSMIFSPRVAGGEIGGGVQHGNAIFKANDVLLLITVFTWLARGAVMKGKAFLVHTPLTFPMMAYTVICAISTGLGIVRGDVHGPLRSMFYVVKYCEYYVMFFMAVNLIETKEEVRKYLRYMWLTAVLVTAFGYSQIPSGQRVSAPFDQTIGNTGEAATTEPNTFGGYYIVIIGIMLGFFTQNAGELTKAMLISIIYMLPPFLLTESRSSYIGLSMALLFHMIATRRRRIVLLFGIGLAALLVAGVPRLRKTITERIDETFVSQGGGTGRYQIGGKKIVVEGSANARIQNWTFILGTAFPRQPVLGYGVTGVGLIDAYYPLLLGETGLAGFLCFFWLLSRISGLAWTIFRHARDPDDKALALGVVTALFGLLFHAIGANTFIIVRIMEPFWFAAALLARVYLNMKEEEAPEGEPA